MIPDSHSCRDVPAASLPRFLRVSKPTKPPPLAPHPPPNLRRSHDIICVPGRDRADEQRRLHHGPHGEVRPGARDGLRRAAVEVAVADPARSRSNRAVSVSGQCVCVRCSDSGMRQLRGQPSRRQVATARQSYPERSEAQMGTLVRERKNIWDRRARRSHTPVVVSYQDSRS